MKILHLNTFDCRGGAARAAYRIHKALNGYGIESQMLVSIKASQDKSVITAPISFFRGKNKITRKILSFQATSNPTLHSLNLFTSGVSKIINESDADIVHFHWIANEFISIPEIMRIQKPIVWTLHDMWAFSGAEHYENINEPGRYKKGYFSNTKSKDLKGFLDVDAWIWRRKKKYWNNNKFNFVTPSKWLGNCLTQSKLFYGVEPRVIPNCLDTTVFLPVLKDKARKALGLPIDKKIILFGAEGGTRNPLKGYNLLEKSLAKISEINSNNVVCVIFGGNGVRERKQHGLHMIDMGHVGNDKKLAMLYGAADVFVTPSMIDNLPNTVMEAMSCGIPSVAYDVGGFVDLIDHKKNGFLVRPFNTDKFAAGIMWVIQDEAQHKELAICARRKVESNFTPNVVARQYGDVYHDLLRLK